MIVCFLSIFILESNWLEIGVIFNIFWLLLFVCLLRDKERRDLLVDFCLFFEDVLGCFVEGVFLVGDLAFVCFFVVFSNFFFTIFANNFIILVCVLVSVFV